jgi:hypothetical protein
MSEKFGCKSVGDNWDGLSVLECRESGKWEFRSLIQSVCPNISMFKVAAGFMPTEICCCRHSSTRTTWKCLILSTANYGVR